MEQSLLSSFGYGFSYYVRIMNYLRINQFHLLHIYILEPLWIYWKIFGLSGMLNYINFILLEYILAGNIAIKNVYNFQKVSQKS
jgi:hypothetical protein